MILFKLPLCRVSNNCSENTIIGTKTENHLGCGEISSRIKRGVKLLRYEYINYYYCPIQVLLKAYSSIIKNAPNQQIEFTGQ
jgi:hypothetical protein